MRTILLIHILAGGSGLLSGYVALSVTKGATLHRRSGMLFVCVMLTMAITGMLISAVEGVAPEINVPSALLVFYLVITSLTTVRTPAPGLRWADRAAMLMALAIAIGCFALGFRAIANGSREAGMAYPLFMFGLVALLGSRGDLRTMRSGGLRGRPRLVRHLWRMCVALFIASIAFFLGRNRVPEAFRHPALLASGVLLPIVSMLYWQWRLRNTRTFDGFVGLGSRRATVAAAADSASHGAF